MRLLYLYPEEWTGRRAREVQTLSTCVALAESGVEVTLVTAGGEQELHDHLLDLAHATEVPGLELVALSRTLGPVQSTAIFSRNFNYWLGKREPFDLAYIIHLKAGAILTQAQIPYAYEAHGIFTPTQQNPSRQRLLHKVEGQVLSAATILISTSAPLAMALQTWFHLTKDFLVVPNAGMPPLENIVSEASGPFVYCGSIGSTSDLANMITAAQDTQAPLRIIGGTEEEWHMLGEEVVTSDIEWHPQVPLSQLPGFLAGARAGLIPINPDMAGGEFSCPIKLFDYARCGLQVLSTALPALQSLEVGPWCMQVPSPARLAWVEALQKFTYEIEQAEAARLWSDDHTWARRAEQLKQAFGIE